MTRKHYVELAKIVARIENDAQRQATLNDICGWCKRENPNFNRKVFVKAVDMYKDLHNDYTESH